MAEINTGGTSQGTYEVDENGVPIINELDLEKKVETLMALKVKVADILRVVAAAADEAVRIAKSIRIAQVESFLPEGGIVEDHLSTELKAKISAIATNTTDIATNTAAIAANTVSIGTNTTNIATNTTDIAACSDQIGTLLSDIASLTSRVVALEEKTADVLITAISLSSATSNVEEGGKTLKINATVTPSNATEGLVWTSDDTSVATVDQQGNVTSAQNVDEDTPVTITCKSASGAVSKSKTITVKNKVTVKAFVGKSASVPTSLVTGTEKTLSGNTNTVILSANSAEGIRTMWVAIPVGSGYSVTGVKDKELQDVDVSISSSISGYTLYYTPVSSGYINNDYTFTITKQ